MGRQLLTCGLSERLWTNGKTKIAKRYSAFTLMEKVGHAGEVSKQLDPRCVSRSGNEIERRNRREDEDYRVSVRMDDGSYRDIIMPDRPDLRVGDRVIVENDRVYRR